MQGSDVVLMFHKVIDVCREHLWTSESGSKVLSYLRKQRCLTDETINSFGLGCFPENPKQVTDFIGGTMAYKFGIASYSFCEFSSVYMVIIPICDQYGVPVGIMGRSLIDEASRPRYHNSIYNKSGNLFSLNKAIPYIRKSKTVYLFEGNFDVMMSHQIGHKNAVAVSSASLSAKQYSLLCRYAEKIVVAFDNDQAGCLAKEKIKARYPDVEVLNLPKQYKDADEYFRSKYCATVNRE